MSILLCDSCENKAICRVREMKDELYPGTLIDVQDCNRYGGAKKAAAPVVPAPVSRIASAPRSMKELANISERIKAITKENTGEKESFKCPVCGRETDVEAGVTDISSGKVICQECYDKQ